MIGGLQAKYLKKSVGNIRKLQEKFRYTVQNGDLVISIIRVCFLIDCGQKWIQRIASV